MTDFSMLSSLRCAAKNISRAAIILMVAIWGAVNLCAQGNCELPCCCPFHATCQPPPEGNDCGEGQECRDKWNNTVDCPDDDDDDDGGGGDPPGECEDKWGYFVACEPGGGGEDPCPDGSCCDPNSANYSAAVALAAGCGEPPDPCDDPELCGSCVPDQVIWTCNRYYPYDNNGLWCSPDSGAVQFNNKHDFEFTLRSVPQGTGLSSTEVIVKRATIRIDSSDGGPPLYYQQFYVGPNPYVKTMELVCAQLGCSGPNKVSMGDSYTFDQEGAPGQLYINHFCDAVGNCNVAPCAGPGRYVFTAKHEWIDQKIYVNYGTSDSKLIKNFGTSAVTIKKNVVVIPAPGEPPCGANCTVSYEDCSLSKSGNL